MSKKQGKIIIIIINYVIIFCHPVQPE